MSDKPQRKRVRLGELLISEGKISDAQLREALSFQKQTGKKLGRALTDVGAISEHELHVVLARHLGIERSRRRCRRSQTLLSLDHLRSRYRREIRGGDRPR